MSAATWGQEKVTPYSEGVYSREAAWCPHFHVEPLTAPGWCPDFPDHREHWRCLWCFLRKEALGGQPCAERAVIKLRPKYLPPWQPQPSGQRLRSAEGLAGGLVAKFSLARRQLGVHTGLQTPPILCPLGKSNLPLFPRPPANNFPTVPLQVPDRLTKLF